MTLHSDQNSIRGMNNSTSCFKVYLGHELLLPGKWEVGLAEIYFPLTLKTLSNEESTITVENLHPKTGDVLSVKHVFLSADKNGVASLDSKLFFLLLRDALRSVNIDMWLEEEVRVHMSADAKTKKIYFSDKMRILLGFSERSYVLDPVIIGVQGFNTRRILPQQLHVSTDLIYHQLVGGTYDQIIRSVHVDVDTYSYGCMGNASFENIQYYAVDQQKVDDIGIYIKDKNGDCVSFASGTSTVILHFRETNDG